ncbi:hypothetical protein [Sneathiella sp.]|jgi:hypothetical protein|uniref:hypothetical protein n=1 Tax=Sneathiella sp. TaxID=1964365 RepID=UPI0039E6C257
MEVVRSVSYPVKTLNPSAHPQREERAYVEARLEEQRVQRLNREIEQESQQNISGRRHHAVVVAPDDRRANVTSIFLQQHSSPLRKLEGLSHPPLGQSSSAFVAQQLSQASAHETDISAHNPHHEAVNAYVDTKNLTATIMGFQGFRERLA